MFVFTSHKPTKRRKQLSLLKNSRNNKLSIFLICINTLCYLLGLADPVHPANRLQLVSWVQDWLNQQHVSRFNDVQAVGARVKRKKEDVDLLFVFKGAQILLNDKQSVTYKSEPNLGSSLWVL